MKNTDNSIIRISNVLNLTRQEFSVIEKHIFHSVLKELKENQGFHIKNIDNELPLKVIINANDILKNSKNIDILKEAVKKITSRSIYFDKSTPEDYYFGSVVPIPYARYTSTKGSKSEILIEIHHTCKKLFLEFAGGYTTLQLDAILNLKSEYSIRMYEILSMYKAKKAWSIKLEELRSLLGLGLLEYKNFGMFEKRILLYSQKELLEHCNLYFSWEISSKKGKKITGLTFNILDKDKQEKVELDSEIKQTVDYINNLKPFEIAQKIHMASTKYTLKPEQIDYIISDNKVFNEFIRIDLIIESMIEKQNPPKDRTKYLAKSLGLDKVKFKQKV